MPENAQLLVDPSRIAIEQLGAVRLRSDEQLGPDLMSWLEETRTTWCRPCSSCASPWQYMPPPASISTDIDPVHATLFVYPHPLRSSLLAVVAVTLRTPQDFPSTSTTTFGCLTASESCSDYSSPPSTTSLRDRRPSPPSPSACSTTTVLAKITIFFFFVRSLSPPITFISQHQPTPTWPAPSTRLSSLIYLLSYIASGPPLSPSPLPPHPHP
ncbi:hypothetical protein SISNIDRAFT_469851 [Sistotremastrum niveocremeum HHB9708]|uniref:Uncharacterized protein n=1 Tax=Sistotremastrum niveocremeum HHB9708 TaxID=1314777 RepID=A0A164PIX5_9AGAM|nr:hypothetical protein SISNIDRAFT_469851 [Sistotremastrum niveocremeum HHB9708]